uniref:Alsin Rho guanine nucleotide exchange factor ALS2 a n=1 Tax=Echeneis naucrates TaxID=173247 RepID=A0A665UNW0_ECHNA
KEKDLTSPERGLLHVWHSAGPFDHLCPERVLLSRPVLQATLGEHHGVLLTQGGQVYSFGELLWRDLSIPVSAPLLEVSLLGKLVVHVAAGGFHCGALTEQGNIYMWGENTAGQCGLTDLGAVKNITGCVVDSEAIPPAAVRIVDLACGREHSLALSSQNELWAWGSGCQLGLVTNAFPVLKPQKVSFSMDFLQVACGAYHSLALVRSLPPQNYNTQKCPEKKERGQSPHFSVTGKEDMFAVDEAHYCPLGVELKDTLTREVSIIIKENLTNQIMDMAYILVVQILSTARPLHSFCNPGNERIEEFSAMWIHTQNLVLCLHPKTLSPTLYLQLYLRSYSNSGVFGPYSSSSPVCLEEVRLRLEAEKKELQWQKSSSLTNINQKAKTAANRRRSLPGTPTHGRNGWTAAHEEAGDGLPSLETEVWSWGRGSEGQLGHGDQLARLQPLCIKSLTGEEVIKVSAGSHHSLALSAQCQVYSWGSNMCGQLGHGSSPVTVPQQAKLSDGLRVWDVSAGQSHSLLLADGDCVQPILLYCGQCQESMPCPCINGLSFLGGQRCAVLADQNVMGFISTIHELASKERHFYCWLSSIRKLLLNPLQSVCSTLGEPRIHLFFSLCESFDHLNALIGQDSTSLNYFLHDVQRCNVTTLPLLTHTDCFLDSYKKYCSALGNVQVMGGFQSLHKLSLECLGSQQITLAQLCASDQSVSGDVDLVSLMYWPLQQLHQYSRVLLKLAACYDVLTVEYQYLHQTANQYESVYLSLLRRKKEAESTFLFWKTHSGKIAEVLRLPHRRIVCESSNRSLTLQKAGRFSHHWFILFNDALVHTQFSSHHVYPLTCLWVKPVTEDSNALYAIKITCPEETFTMVASTPQEKNKWLRSLNQAVDQVLGGGGQGSSPGVAVMSRAASYTFTGDGRFKDAHYHGSWLGGRVHGRGTMKWPDGRTYKGNFKNGQEDGYGECIIPNKVLNKPDSYQGNWKDGKIHGFGKYKYANGEVYEGCYYEGQRHGYGMLSSGKRIRASSSVFIGQWLQDKRTGYGVYDDITRLYILFASFLNKHEKYICINFDVMCVFSQGSGLLLSDDDTYFHGEFSDDWTINGKGVLSLVNGDCIDGQFSGEWSAGLKVVGTYTKPAINEPENKERSRLFKLGQYVVPADQRWGCVFNECWSRLGCDTAGRGERTKAWENIAVTITTARRHSPGLSRSQSKVLECLEFIPQHEESVTTANYDNIRRYLIKACETPLHPLGWLVETLVTVYRMTYIGVGSNRRLLSQAVQEVLAYLTHFNSIVRFLFPGLPEDGGIIPDPPISPSTSRCVANSLEQGVVVFSSSSLLLPLLLPQLYPPLFTLYCLQQEQEEAQYWERILQLNKQPDQSLLSFLGVQDSKDACFISAVETLQQISTTFTPSDKLLVIQKTFEELTQEVKPMLDDDFLWCMDDLLPLFIYVVIRARIRNLGAEVSLIEDLMDPNIQHGEMGLMFTTLKACYIQIQHESTI